VNALDRLCAIESIKQCKARYAICADTKDWDGFGKVFAIDCEHDERDAYTARHPGTGEWNSIGSGFDLSFLEGLISSIKWPIVGREAVVKTLREHAQHLSYFHKLFAPVIEVVSETSAKGIWPFEDVLYYLKDGPVKHFNGMGHYRETYSCVDGEWLIQTCWVSRTFFRIS
jgi:hypothetical protein